MADLEDHAVVHRLSRENESDFRFRKSFPPKVTRVVESVKHNGRPLPADSLDLKQNESLSEGDNCHEARTKRKRRRRAQRKSRRWRPYAELSWEEKKILEEKESLRASRIRAEMFAKGQPVAPYNTTQFLMEDHDLKEPDLKTGDSTPKRLAGRREDTSEDDFNEDGDGMSSDELIKEYLELERCLSTKEEENRKLKLSEEQHQKASTEQRRVQELEREIERLKDENLRLTREREPLSMDKENIQINQNY